MKIILAKPRGFCAGVQRALDIVHYALDVFGPPLYVRHEIVHNFFVVESLKKKNVIFADDINAIPCGSRVVISAHGTSRSVIKEANDRNLHIIDATCPLVTKIHRSVSQFERRCKKIILIGHKNHPEVIGTSGQVDGNVILIENEFDARTVVIEDPHNLAYVTQTTLSIDDVEAIIAILRIRFPGIEGDRSGNICYATQNRQNAIKLMLPNIDLLLIIGSVSSSNSNRLRDIGLNANLPSYLIDGYKDLQNSWFDNIKNVGISAGASAPESLVQEVICYLRDVFHATVDEVCNVDENIVFHMPRMRPIMQCKLQS